MKANVHPRFQAGFTILEMTMVILVMLGLLGLFVSANQGIGDWQKGKDAAITLREVETAQRQYLADNPQVDLSAVTGAQVANYLEGGPASLPQVESLKGDLLTIDVTQSPPVVVDAGGATYDPSGSPDDSLWDVGK
ncbi:MAG: type II secretion system protein [Verrucomicrobiota bacterium]